MERWLSGQSYSNPGDQPVLAAAAVAEACRVPLQTSLVHAVVERLGDLDGPDHVDRLIDAVIDSQPINRPRLAELARWICASGVTVNQVKAGIALLGIAGSPRDAPLVSTLGLLDLLTLYSVVALTRLLPDAHPAIFDLAKQSTGWARANALRRLVGTTDPAIRDWILRGGYDCDLVVEETAYIGATSGGLAAALQGTMDDELLDHAGILLAALARGGPAEHLSHYASGGLALELYLTEMATATVTISGFESLDTLTPYLSELATHDPHSGGEDWKRLAALAHTAFDRPEWAQMVKLVLASDNVRDVCRATDFASRLGLDVESVLKVWLEREPHEDYVWFWLSTHADRDGILELLEAAERLLRIGDMPAGGPRPDVYSSEAAAQRCFEIVLGALDRFPLVGWQAIAIGLRSDSFRSRSLAQNAFARWPADGWPADARDLLQECARVESDATLRERFASMLG